MNSLSEERQVGIQSLRLASQMVVMIGLAMTLLYPVGGWYCSGDLRSDGMNALRGSFDAPTVYLWFGVALMIVGTIMQFILPVGFCGGVSLLGFPSLLRQFMFPGRSRHSFSYFSRLACSPSGSEPVRRRGSLGIGERPGVRGFV